MLQWDRPTDVTVKNCNVIGAVRILGMDISKHRNELIASSHKSGHAQRMRNAAPTRVAFEKVVVGGVRR